MFRSRICRLIVALATMTSASCASSFNPPGSPSSAAHYRITGPSTLLVGESVALLATEESVARTDVTTSGTWRSSSAAATVSQAGLLTGVSAGAVVVTFSLVGTTATLLVEVK